MTAARITAMILAAMLAGCSSAGEPPALAPGTEEAPPPGDPYFLKRGFMGGFENRVFYEPRSAARTAASPDL